jgi:preprotein translocase subunit SecE
MAEEVVSISQKAASWPTNVKNYIEELRMEMRRVTWPAWKQVRATTSVVIAATFAFAAYFAVVDAIVGRMIEKLLGMFTPK